MTQTSFRPAQIDATVYLAEGARIVGDVTILAESSVWFNAVVRADCEAVRIGRRTNIQDNAVLHADPGIPCIVGDGVTIGHGAIVHGATVADNVTIGMGAIVLNRATIGRDSLIGAGALVSEGTEIPPGSLALGVPAKVRRALTPEEIEGLRLSAAHYVEASAAFRAEKGDRGIGVNVGMQK